MGQRISVTPVGWAALGLVALAIAVAAVASAAVGLIAILVVTFAIGAAVVSRSPRLRLVRRPLVVTEDEGGSEEGLPSQTLYQREGATFRDRMYPR